MSLNVVWKTYAPETIARGYWDQGIIEDLFAGRWHVPHFQTFNHCEDFGEVPQGEGAVVVIPARHNAPYTKRINKDINRFPWVVLVLTGDEESAFDWEAITHRNIRKWVMSPKPGLHPHDKGMQYLGSGYPPQAREHLANTEGVERDLPVFFSGQDTHTRRHECMEVMGTIRHSEAQGTEGFTQGLEHDVYYRNLARAMIAPCPSGPVSVDSFRLYEALEAGCVPVADGQTPEVNMREHWSMVFGEAPAFPVVDDWSELTDLMSLNDRYPSAANKIGSWWELKKRDLAVRLTNDLTAMEAPPATPRVSDDLSVIMVTSPIEGHPDTSVIEETIKSVQARMPDAEIFVLCDGVRLEQEHYRQRYEKYLTSLLWKARNEWTNVYPIIWEEHMHQAAMVRDFLSRDTIRTPLMMFVEHDTPLVGDIPFYECNEALLTGQTKVIRFHHEAVVPWEHWPLYPDGEEGAFDYLDLPFIRTIQWSQRPHMATVEFYRQILGDHFSAESRTMIEDTMHSVAQDPDWNDNNIWIYYPPGDCKRSTHLDARGNKDPKFEMIK